MPRYLIRDDGLFPEQTFDAVSDETVIEWAREALEESDAEPGEEIAVFRLDDEGVEEHIATLAKGEK